MKILLADHNQNSRTSVAKFLKRNNCQVDEFENGFLAFRNFLIDSYQMVLAEVNMPQMGGIELLKAISASPYRNNVDVVLYTDQGDPDTTIQALRLRAFDYLLKPLDEKELTRVLDKVCIRRKRNYQKIKFFMVHKNSLFNEGLKFILDQNKLFSFIGEVENLYDALYSLETLQVDLLLIDWEICQQENQEIIWSGLKGQFPEMKIVVFYALDDLIQHNIKQYVSGSIPKNAEVAEVVSCLQRLHKGEEIMGFFVSPEVSKIEDKLALLTPVEYQILKLLGQGLANKEISDSLSLSYSTVRTYVSRIFQKLDMTNRAEAAIFAVKYLE